MKNKLYIFLILLICIAIMTRYKITIIHEDTKNNGKVPDNYFDEPSDSELQYFDSVEEAIKASKIVDYEVTDLRNIVKVVENDNECVVFFVNREDGKDYLCTNKLRIKNDGGKKYYSLPLFVTRIQWYVDKYWTNAFIKDVRIMSY